MAEGEMEEKEKLEQDEEKDEEKENLPIYPPPCLSLRHRSSPIITNPTQLHQPIPTSPTHAGLPPPTLASQKLLWCLERRLKASLPRIPSRRDPSREGSVWPSVQRACVDRCWT
ncbi:hypothetical protein O3P69_005983 [Scylla paramamosain]|uniref:Uncharacterized protein n=1 Tax=Scylla paramamosain TaxID=85552 RepID=A0AAW0U489_SCYPA